MWRMWTATLLKHHFIFLWTNISVDSLGSQANTVLSQHFLQHWVMNTLHNKNMRFSSSHIFFSAAFLNQHHHSGQIIVPLGQNSSFSHGQERLKSLCGCTDISRGLAVWESALLQGCCWCCGGVSKRMWRWMWLQRLLVWRCHHLCCFINGIKKQPLSAAVSI